MLLVNYYAAIRELALKVASSFKHRSSRVAEKGMVIHVLRGVMGEIGSDCTFLWSLWERWGVLFCYKEAALLERCC